MKLDDSWTKINSCSFYNWSYREFDQAKSLVKWGWESNFVDAENWFNEHCYIIVCILIPLFLIGEIISKKINRLIYRYLCYWGSRRDPNTIIHTWISIVVHDVAFAFLVRYVHNITKLLNFKVLCSNFILHFIW